MQGLQSPDASKILPPNNNNIFSSELVGDASINAFSNIEAQKEIAALHENLKSVSSSFDIKSWETLTQKHLNFHSNPADEKIMEASSLHELNRQLKN